MRLSEREFDRIVKKAIRRIPPEIRSYLDNILISVKKRPSRKMLEELEIAPGETLLGIYQGVSLAERSSVYPPLYPDMILLFQEPLEESSDNLEELEDEIRKTVIHEVGHFVGLSEERLAELGCS